MEKKVPDSYVPDRYTKSYPTEIGSQPFEPDNIDLFKLDNPNVANMCGCVESFSLKESAEI